MASRVEHAISTICSIHIHWSTMFHLPSSIMEDVNRVYRRFIWCNKGKDISLDFRGDIFLPKEEGGLGVKSIFDLVKIDLTKSLCDIISKRQSLWIK